MNEAFHDACNQIVPVVVEHRCWNRFSLHHLVDHQIRKKSRLGSQMVCNAIFSVCKAYRAKGILKGEEIPLIQFRSNRSVHFDKRTYKIQGDNLSLYTLEKRISVKMRFGPFQREYFSLGLPKEGELILKKGRWYFNLVLELPDPPQVKSSNLLGVDLGENNVYAASNGKIVGGGKIRHKRDQFLAKRRRLQSNGSQSAKQLLKKISGRERRRMRQINHELSKEIVEEAIRDRAKITFTK